MTGRSRYLPESGEDPEDFAAQSSAPAPFERPRVIIQHIDGELWTGVWEDGVNAASFDGDLAAVIAWAGQHHGCEKSIWDLELGRFVPLD